jgi:hypothetical protein
VKLKQTSTSSSNSFAKNVWLVKIIMCCFVCLLGTLWSSIKIVKVVNVHRAVVEPAISPESSTF